MVGLLGGPAAAARVRTAMRGTGKPDETRTAARRLLPKSGFLDDIRIFYLRLAAAVRDHTHARTDRRLARSTAKYLVLDSPRKF